ncbi:MAG TPA: histidine ammonia-lyase [Candidatus Acidoferrales bacterium]|jgi:histidine ammonia-lyase|nr:histidine ammonia-lyase [Candidatus Acidoferrales bacterium]
MKTVLIDGNSLTLEGLYRVVFHGATAEIPLAARESMKASRAVIERLVEADTVVYGVNTGFGKMASTRISRDEIRQLQLNLVRSHACGVGAPLSENATRAMLALRANAIVKGFSGVRPIVAETLVAMLNRGVHPVIPSQGSVGASGDLAPLAHLAQVAIGEGRAILRGRTMTGAEAMRAADLAPLTLDAKEGLALLNGTQAMLALAALALREAEIAADTADVAAALSLDALRGSPAAFDARIAGLRPHPGHAITARNIERMNRGSEIRESHRSPEKDPRVQDPYSLRCAPQVHGAVRDALAQIRATLAIELNSATDNPLVFVNSKDGAGEVISGGNFHGQPLAMAADQMAVALATLGGISERRIEQMTNPQTSQLPAFLVRHAGLNSGFMILQVTAASLASELKPLAAPHSVDSIPTSANQEDYVSMGMGGARRLEPMLANLQNILAIELLAACQGIDLLSPLRPGPETRKAYDIVRALSPAVDTDRSLAPDIEVVAGEVAKGSFTAILR